MYTFYLANLKWFSMEFCFNSVSCSSFYPAFVFEVLKDAEDLVQHQFGRFVVGASTPLIFRN